MNERKSVTAATAGSMAYALSFIAVFWIAMLFIMREAFASAPLFFAGLFWLVGALVAFGALSQLRERWRAGSARLILPMDPLPLGVPIDIRVDFDKPPASGTWKLIARVLRERQSDESARELWRDERPLTQFVGNSAKITVRIPEHVPATDAGEAKAAIGCNLSINGPHGSWSFAVATRVATQSERALHASSGRDDGDSQRKNPRPQIASQRWQLLLVPALVTLVGVGVVIFMVLDFFGGVNPLTPSYAVPKNVPQFALPISNWHGNNWHVQAQLDATARIANGVLEVDVETLRMRGFQRCTGQSRCAVEQARLVLAQDGERNFQTLAQSNVVPVQVTLHDYAVQQTGGHKFQMTLPAKLPRDGAYLKLQLQFPGPSWIYVDSPHLLLQQVIAQHTGEDDPCNQISSLSQAMRGGCPAAFANSLIARPSASERIERLWGQTLQVFGVEQSSSALSPDAALILALRLGADDWMKQLLQQGASPNARDPDNQHLTAVALAAEFDALEALDILVAAGGDPKIQTINDRGQTVTPLHRALRHDAAATVARLLELGARPVPPDATGWSTMHVAAYEGAVKSLPLLVRAGGDVNERTPVAPEQIPLMTAIQHSNAATVRALIALGADVRARDNQGRTSCDWARQFKREAETVGLACDPTSG